MKHFTTKTLFLIVAICISVGAFAQEASMNMEPLEGMAYRNVGPLRGGRVTTVAGIPSQPSVFYMGSTGGGVWKTTDYGQNWNNVSDGYFQSPSTGAIRVAESDPNIVYVGTGSDGIRSNVITGKGVYKSTDAGESWDFLGLKETGQIGAVEIDPSNPDRVFVAAIGQAFSPNDERGVFRTEDGGANWEKVLFHSDSVGSADLEFKPDDSQVIYATLWLARRKPWTIISGGTEGGIYKSTDGGDTWEKKTNGLPQNLIGKIDLAVSADDPERLYAMVEAPVGEGGLYRSDDAGESFTLISTKKELLDRPFYYCNVDANPKNADEVFSSATRFFRSANGGESWEQLSTPHGDNHDLWINPNDTSIWIQSNDGGANVTLNGGKTWSTQYNQPTSELYQVDVDDQLVYWLYAGQQDNTTIAVPSLPPFGPQAGATAYIAGVGGCETGPAVPKPGDPNIVYANCKGRFGVYNKTTGQEQQYYVGASNMYGHNPTDLKYRFQRVSPVHVSPHNPDVVYHTSQFVHKTTDDGKTWETISPDLTAFTPETQVISGSPITRDVTGEEFYSTIYDIRESPVQEGVIWTGANDGPVYVTQNGGGEWTNVTPKDLAGGGRVETIDPSPHQAGKAYFATYRYLMGDWKPYIYKTEDFGKTWELLTDGANGIPADYPTFVIREDPEKEGLLYAGTMFGAYVSFDDGKQWQPFQQNLPITPITDMKIHQDDLVLSTMGRGFWIMDGLSPLRAMTQEVASELVALFPTTDAYRMRYEETDSATAPMYPGAGVIIDYYLADDASDALLEVVDANGQVIRSFSSKGSQGEAVDKTPDMGTGFSALDNQTMLSSSAGGHRMVWDLRQAGPWHEQLSRRGQGGPMVVPGTYTIRLTANGTTVEETAEVKEDPRVMDAGVTATDLKAQQELALQVRDLLSEARKLEYYITSRKSELDSLMEQGKLKGSMKKELKAINEIMDQITTAEGRYMTPMLVDQTSYLYYMLEQADQRPGKDAYERYQALQQQYKSLQTNNNEYIESW
ncbi:MAG: hypothetical protein RIG62_30420 [Cyclobacteriaceae bacterium]